VQERLSPDAGVAEPIRISFDPAAGVGLTAPVATSTRTLVLPLQVSGLGPESILMNDRAVVRLVSRDGTTLYRGKSTPFLGYGDDFVVRTTAGDDVRTRQQIVVPAGIYDRLRNQSVGVEIDYSLTLFHLAAEGPIAALHGHQWVSAFGWCRTEIDEDGDELQLGCVQPGAAPTCVSVTVENATTVLGNMVQWSCDPDYAPYHMHLYPDSVSRLALSVRLRDGRPTGRDAVDGAQLADATLRLKSYRPEAHFTRRLVIPDVRVPE
jgi:hypothetical protein